MLGQYGSIHHQRTGIIVLRTMPTIIFHGLRYDRIIEYRLIVFMMGFSKE